MLPRHKPSPIPSIHPVPEYQATGPLSDLYAATKKGLNVPWMGVVAMAFAHYPNFYARLWQALAPIAGTTAFAAACQNLRTKAEAEAARFDPPNILQRLERLGYGETEVAAILACNETFSAGNMPYVLMATLARQVLEGHDWSGEGPDLEDATRLTPHPPRPVLMEAHHGTAEIQALYADIRTVLGLPFVNTDYRAFSRWPSYFLTAWEDFRHLPANPDYEASVTGVHDEAIALLAALPNVTKLQPADLIAAAEADASAEELLQVVRLFQWLLPGLAFNVAYFRAQLLPAQQA